MPEVGEVFSRYNVAGKTGTSENGDVKDTINSWYVSFAPADDPEYVVVVNQCKTDNKKGFRMMPAAAEIYEYLFSEGKQQ
jgi:peptidoglycan glycosyltransferase